jgi:hypothetical protein
MVKISKMTGQHKHAGPAEELDAKSSPRRRKLTRKRPNEPARVERNDTVTAKTATNPRQQMSRTRDWRYRDHINLEEQGDQCSDDDCLAEPPQETEPQQPNAPQLLTHQGNQFQSRPPDGSDDDEAAEADDADEFGDLECEEPDFEDDGEYSAVGADEDDEAGYYTDDIQESPYGGDEEYSQDDDDDAEPSDAGAAEEGPVKAHWLMTKLKQVDRPTLVFRMVRQIVDSGDQAIVLGQIMFWFDLGKNGKPRAGTLKKGKRWLFKSHAEFAIETGIPERRIRSCLDWLKKAGFIEVAYFRANGQRTSHFRLNVTAVYEAIVKRPKKRPENPGATVSVARSD